MQEKKLNFERLLASLIVLMLLAVNFLPSLKLISYALEEVEELEVVGNFQIGDGELANSASLDVGEQNGKIILDVKINGKGYLKSGSFNFDGKENFKIQEASEDLVKNGKIKVKMVDKDNPDKIVLPIQFNAKSEYEQDYFNKKNKIKFSGTYVDNNGNEEKIEKEIVLTLAWTESFDVNIENEVVKNIEYEQDGVNTRIVQSILKISKSNVDSKLPVQSSHVEIDIPQIEGLNLVNTKVKANKLAFSQGTEDADVVFDESNYKIDGNIIRIDVSSVSGEKVKLDNFGEDIYALTFIYNGTSDVQSVDGKVRVVANGFTGITEENTAVINYDLADATKKLVSYYRENKTDTISLGYLVANSIQNRYDISYNKKDVLNISRPELLSGIEVIDSDEYFTTEDGKIFNIDTFYNSTKFNKEELQEVLGEEGYVEILNTDGKVIAKVEAKKEADEEGNIVVDYSEDISTISYRTSEPKEEGTITVLSNKWFNTVPYSKNEIASFSELINSSHAYAYYKEGFSDDLGKVESGIIVTPTFTNATAYCSTNTISTVSENKGVNFQIYLNNSEDTSDLYESPIFEIKFPMAVTNVDVSNVNLFYANNELAISNVETLNDNEGRIVLRVALTGNQVSYDLNKETNGTVISFDADITLDEFTTGITEDIEILYANFAATGYYDSTEWKMLSEGSGSNGIYTIPISYDVPEGLVNVQTTEIESTEKTVEETEEVTAEEDLTSEENEKDNSKVVSIKQGVQDGFLQEGVEAQLATMTISVLNNTNKRYTSFSILGRIPFKGNKDVRTGKDLGTTVDTILDKQIKSLDPNLAYDVYYSENEEATEDLFAENNNWSKDFDKMGAIKSYLIIIDPTYILEPNNTLEFEYDYIIPANLGLGEAMYGTYASFYKEIVGDTVQENTQANESADAVGYKTSRKATVEAEFNLVSKFVQERFDADFELKVRNTSDVDASNVYAQITIPNYFNLVDVFGIDGTYEVEGSTLQLLIPEVKAGEEKVALIKFNVNSLAKTENASLSVGIFGDSIQDTVTATTQEFEIQKAKLLISDAFSRYAAIPGVLLPNTYSMMNVSEESMGRVEFTRNVGEAFKIEELVVSLGSDGVTTEIDNENHYFKIIIDDFTPGKAVLFEYDLIVNYLDKQEPINKAKIVTTYNLENQEPMTQEMLVDYYTAILDVRNTRNTNSGFSSVGETVDYEYEIVNKSEYDIFNLGIEINNSENEEINYVKVSTTENEEYYSGNAIGCIVAVLKAKENATVTVNATVLEGEKIANNHIALKLDNRIISETAYETIIEDNNEKSSYSIIGMAFVDRNNNSRQDENEEVLDGIVVDLYDSKTNEYVNSTITNVGGRYEFNDIENGQYYVKFDYDDSKYKINTSEQAKVLNINNKNLTDNIYLADKSISNVDLSLTDENIFDLNLDATVEKITVQNSAESTNIVVENNKLAKVDINPDIVKDSKVIIEYKLTVKNQGTIPGKVNKIVDYLPKDFVFDSTLNPDWYLESDGNLYTRSLVNEYINPGEERSLSLVLVREMTGENTGLAHNSFEIVEAMNDMGIKDIDSTFGNKTDEDDFATADVIIGIQTGEILRQLPLIAGGIVVVVLMGILVWRIIDRRRYV